MGFPLSVVVFTGPWSFSTWVNVVNRCCPSKISFSGDGKSKEGTFSTGLTWKRTSPPVSRSITAPTGNERPRLTSRLRTCSSSHTQPRWKSGNWIFPSMISLRRSLRGSLVLSKVDIFTSLRVNNCSNYTMMLDCMHCRWLDCIKLSERSFSK